MNIIEPAGKLGILISVPTLRSPKFSPLSSCAASTEHLLEIIQYKTEERGGSCLPVGGSVTQSHQVDGAIKKIFIRSKENEQSGFVKKSSAPGFPQK
jgi:hypothetical protein